MLLPHDEFNIVQNCKEKQFVTKHQAARLRGVTKHASKLLYSESKIYEGGLKSS